MKKITTSISVFTICLIMLATSCTKEKIFFEPHNEKTTQNNFRDTPYISTRGIKLDTPYLPMSNNKAADTPYIKH